MILLAVRNLVTERTRFAFSAAGIGLAMATVAFLALLLLFGASVVAIFIVAVIMVLLIVGAVMMQRPASQQWFESQGAA